MATTRPPSPVPAPAATPVRGYAADKKALVDRLARVEGQVRGIRRMVEEDAYCIDVLTQVNSVTAALRAVGLGLLEGHVRHCVAESIERGDGEDKIQELLAAVARYSGR